LLELRPALGGHSGIPQETRLLFRGLRALDGVRVRGLIQSSNLAVEPGLALRDGEFHTSGESAEHIDRLSKVVVSLQQGPSSNRFEHLRRRFLCLAGPLGAAAGAIVGRKVPITGFDPTHFKDFVWRSMFEKSLSIEDFNTIADSEFRVVRWPWSLLHAVGVASSVLGRAVYPRLDTRGVDVMVAETPYPGRVSGRTRLVVRYHDAFPLLMPHTIKDRGLHRAMHFQALKRNAADGAWFACVSEATRQDLLSVLPALESRSATIPNMISHHFVPEQSPSRRVPEIIWSRKNRRAPHEGGAPIADHDLEDGELPYLLMVSTVEPRKNHAALLDAWELLRASGFPRLNLVCVGALGWDHESVMKRFAPWLQRGGLHLLEDVPAADLRLLYRHARATVCPSFGEGFDFGGVEAMRSGGVVAASDIRVHRDVYGEAAEYFSPYSASAMAHAIGHLIGPEHADRRSDLRAEGDRVSSQYLPETVLPKWHAFLEGVVSSRGGAPIAEPRREPTTVGLLGDGQGA
jgi:glycosyltransferase involved in cell wall biosynthesis